MELVLNGTHRTTSQSDITFFMGGQSSWLHRNRQ